MADTLAQPIRVPRIVVLRPVEALRLENYALAMVVVLLVTLSFVALSGACRHWFVIPGALCGILLGADVIAWLRRQLDTFDPKALVALNLLPGMFIAPLLHMAYEEHDEFFSQSVSQWDIWFGYLGWLNLGGLLCFRLAQSRVFKVCKPAKTYWKLDRNRFITALSWGAGVAAIATAILFVQYAGMHLESEVRAIGGERLLYASMLLMLGDPLPTIIFMGIIMLLSASGRRGSIFTAGVLLVIFLLTQFMLLGLRGSRSTVVGGLFFVTLLVHYRLRRIGVVWVLAGMVPLFIGVYLYGFFKHAGTVGFRALESVEQRRSMEERTGVTPIQVFTGDLSRAEMQAFEVYRLVEHPGRFQYRWGETYVVSTLFVIPRAIWRTKPVGKIEAGTDIQEGQGAFIRGVHYSSRVYGLAGEAMLNFGLWGIPVAFLVFGALIGLYRKKLLTLRPDDARFFLVPLLSYAAMVGGFADSDNIAFGLLKDGALLVLLVVYSMTRWRLAPRS